MSPVKASPAKDGALLEEASPEPEPECSTPGEIAGFLQYRYELEEEVRLACYYSAASPIPWATRFTLVGGQP